MAVGSDLVAKLAAEALKSSSVSQEFLARPPKSRAGTAATLLALRRVFGGFVTWLEAMKKHAGELDGAGGAASTIVENIKEELGEEAYDAGALASAGVHLEDVEGVAHSVLYTNFLDTLCGKITAEELNDAVSLWRDAYLGAARSSLAEGIGAVGLGCEEILPRIFAQLLENCITPSFPELTRRELVYFYLHIMADEEHAEVLKRVGSELAAQPGGGGGGIVSGLGGVLAAAEAFWDASLELQQVSA